MRKLILAVLVVFSCFSLNSCLRPYKVEIQQGNILTDETVQSIHSGMPVHEVIELLGTPVLETPFDHGQIIYVYSLKKGYHPFIVRRLFVFIENGHVVNTHFETSHK
jgi:outer membrane protein assembly factor BamE